MKVGTYCVGTKYSDGSGADPWAVGFFAGMIGDRFLLVDNEGKLFRSEGFRKIKSITAEQGQHLLDNRDEIELAALSIWTVLRKFDTLVDCR